MTARTAFPILLLAFLVSPGGFAARADQGEDPSGSRGAKGYRLYEETAASVNGRVLFRTELLREACLLRCGAFPGDEPVDLPLLEVRERLIGGILVLQEEEKLGLGQVDNASILAAAAAANARLEICSDPCAREIDASGLRGFVERRLVIREFLRKRVAVFVDVNEEEVRREIARRISRGENLGDPPPEEQVRQELFEEKASREIRNWYDRVASKSKIVRSPLEEP